MIIINFVIYNPDGNILSLYRGDETNVTPNIQVSNADFAMCIQDITSLRVIDGQLKIINNHLPLMRIKRNYLLSESDKYMLLDYPITEEKQNEWKVYRQQLRDFPETCDINNPIWPTPPT